MKPELRPISVTIVDFLGALLPGTVWLILFITSGKLVNAITTSQPKDNSITSLSVTLDLVRGTDNISFYFSLLLISLLIGYAIKPQAMVISERICAIFFLILDKLKKISVFQGKKNKPEEDNLKQNESKTPKLADYRFPFNSEHINKDYYKRIVRTVNEYLAEETTPSETEIKLPKGTQPFSSCRRILRVLNPSLWEETEHREAEVRMLGSIFLSSVFNFVCVLLGIFHNSGKASVIWVTLSAALSIFLLFTFRKARMAEVTYTYLNFIIATKLKSPSNE